MQAQRSLVPRMLITLLALIGFLDSLYLSLSRLKPDNPLACPVGGGCETVQSSVWSTLPPGDGVPVAFIGVVGYLVIVVLGMLALQTDMVGTFAVPTVLLVVTSFGLLFSLYLVVLQIVIVKALCFWCMMSAMIELSLWVMALVDWRMWLTHSRGV